MLPNVELDGFTVICDDPSDEKTLYIFTDPNRGVEPGAYPVELPAYVTISGGVNGVEKVALCAKDMQSVRFTVL